MEIITIKGLKIFAFHGVNPEEKRDGQNFTLDVEITADLKAARLSDNLEDTVNYAAVRKTISAAMTERSYDLIERAADEVAKRIIENSEKIKKVTVTLKKPEAPMNAEFDYVAVTVTEER